MQARILAVSLSAIAMLAFSTGAAAQQRVNSGQAEQRTSTQGPYQLQAASPPARQRGQSAPAPRDPEMPICGHCGADIQAQPAEAGGDFLIRLPGVDGETPPPPPPQNAPAPREQISLNYEEPQASSQGAGASVAAPQDEQAALIVPAVQRVRDVAAAEPAAPAERPRRRGGFSLSIGGVTLSSDGGVNVAVGDIDGDSRRGARSEPSRGSSPPAPARTRGE